MLGIEQASQDVMCSSDAADSVATNPWLLLLQQLSSSSDGTCSNPSINGCCLCLSACLLV
jgi:hypothetical protein